MIAVIDQHNIEEHRGLIDEMFRLRARVFGERLKWNVEITDGMERDRFDNENPVYVIHSDDGTRVLGSLRLLPTTGPTLFNEVFADTLADAAQLCSPTIWECTRLCVDEQFAAELGSDHVTQTAGALIAALGEMGLSAGIESYLGNFDALMFRVYRRLGCEVEVLGQTDRFGRRVYLGLFPVKAEILGRVLAKLNRTDADAATAAQGWQPSAEVPAPSPRRPRELA